MLSIAEEEGAILPALDRKPEIPVYLNSVWEAFGTLSASRPAGMGGPLPIPISEIRAYCGLYGIRDPDEISELVTFIQTMDGAYLEHVTKDKRKDVK